MLATFGMITPVTAGIVLVIALVIFGPGKLPELGKALGRGIKEFKTATDNEEQKQITDIKRDDVSLEKAEK